MTSYNLAIIVSLSPWFAPDTMPDTFRQVGNPPIVRTQQAGYAVIVRGTPFTPQFRATDNASPAGEVPVMVTGYLDTSRVGGYILTCTAADLVGNVSVRRFVYNVVEP